MECDNTKPGSSNSKGKGIDPHEWGNLELDEEELDIMAQEAAFNSYQSCKENTRHDGVQMPKKDLKNWSKDEIKKHALKERASNDMKYNYNHTSLDTQKSIHCDTKS